MIGRNITSRYFNITKRSIISKRFYKVLAIESSCDDSCVALLDKYHPDKPPKVIDHVKKTLHSADLGGIMPTAAYLFHLSTIATMVQEFCSKHNLSSKNPPDLLCVTRGPGMAGSLSTSTEFAKGLSVAWGIPLVGVHHMLGHLLTAKLPKTEQPELGAPEYPFLSLLCSGGHTMLVLLKSLTDHEIIVDGIDIAVGDSLDKCARELGMYGNMLGKELEKYIDLFSEEEKNEFANLDIENRENNEYDFQITLPFGKSKRPGHSTDLSFSFALFLSCIHGYKIRLEKQGKTLDEKTKRMIAYQLQEKVFDHIIDRVNVALKRHGTGFQNTGKLLGVKDFVCSGGVAANRRLREKLELDLKNQETLGMKEKFTFHFPDLSLCTDNAIMIGVAGIDIFEELKLKTDLRFIPIRKWPLDKLMSVDSWIKVDEEEYNRVCKY